MIESLQIAVRTLARERWTTLAACASLSLGTGLATAAFTLVNAVVFADLPVQEPARVVSLGTRVEAQPDLPLVSAREYLALRETQTAIRDLAAFTGGTINISDGTAPPQRWSTAYVTPNTFRALGVSPTSGRDFLDLDDDPAAPAVALLSDAAWSGRYGRDPQAIGRAIQVNGRRVTIVGIMPPGMTFPFDTDLWLPLRPWVATVQSRPAIRNLQSFGRLADGISLTQARAQIETTGARLAEEFPATNRGVVTTLTTFGARYRWPELEQLAVALLSAAVILFLLGVLNVANLLMARAVGREHEIGIRLALGAGRRDLAASIVAEVIVLVGGAVVGAIGIAVVATQGMARWLLTMGAHPYWWSFALDRRVTIFFAGVAALTILIATAAPALYALTRRSLTTLWAGGPATVGRSRVRAWRSALIVIELMVTIALSAGAGLLLRTGAVVRSRHDAVHPDDVLTANLVLPGARYKTPDQIVAFQRDLQERLEAFTSAGTVAISSHLPLKGGLAQSVETERVAGGPDPSSRSVTAVSVTPEYFQVLQLPVTRGRAFTRDDGAPGQRVVVVNQRFVRAYLHANDPLDIRIQLRDERAAAGEDAWAVIVGVVPDVAQREVGGPQAEAVVYVPFRANPQSYMYVSVRSAAEPRALSRQMREAVQAIDPDLPVFDIQSLATRLASATVTWRAFETGFIVLAGIALVLAAIGLYAVTMTWVIERTRELALRVALGATARQVTRLVLVTVGRYFVLGVALGLVAAAAVARSLQGVLIQTAPTDPTVLAACVALVVAAGAGACIRPIRRAVRLEPAVALRAQ